MGPPAENGLHHKRQDWPSAEGMDREFVWDFRREGLAVFLSVTDRGIRSLIVYP